MASTLTVVARPIPSIPAGHEVVSCARRSTKENKVAEADRYRAIVVPELSVAESGLPDKFASIVLGALRRTASDQLAAMWADATDSFTECPGDVWTVDALLAFADRVSQSQRLTREAVAAWFDSSAVKSKLIPKGPKVVAKFLDGFQGLAGAVTYSEEKCQQLLAILAKESAAVWQVPTMVRKLTERIERLQDEAAEIDGFALDD